MLWDNMSFISWKNESNLFLSILQNIVMLNFLKRLFLQDTEKMYKWER